MVSEHLLGVPLPSRPGSTWPPLPAAITICEFSVVALLQEGPPAIASCWPRKVRTLNAISATSAPVWRRSAISGDRLTPVSVCRRHRPSALATSPRGAPRASFSITVGQRIVWWRCPGDDHVGGRDRGRGVTGGDRISPMGVRWSRGYSRQAPVWRKSPVARPDHATASFPSARASLGLPTLHVVPEPQPAAVGDAQDRRERCQSLRRSRDAAARSSRIRTSHKVACRVAPATVLRKDAGAAFLRARPGHRSREQYSDGAPSGHSTFWFAPHPCGSRRSSPGIGRPMPPQGRQCPPTTRLTSADRRPREQANPGGPPRGGGDLHPKAPATSRAGVAAAAGWSAKLIQDCRDVSWSRQLLA